MNRSTILPMPEVEDLDGAAKLIDRLVEALMTGQEELHLSNGDILIALCTFSAIGIQMLAAHFEKSTSRSAADLRRTALLMINGVLKETS